MYREWDFGALSPKWDLGRRGGGKVVRALGNGGSGEQSSLSQLSKAHMRSWRQKWQT